MHTYWFPQWESLLEKIKMYFKRHIYMSLLFLIQVKTTHFLQQDFFLLFDALLTWIHTAVYSQNSPGGCPCRYLKDKMWKFALQLGHRAWESWCAVWEEKNVDHWEVCSTTNRRHSEGHLVLYFSLATLQHLKLHLWITAQNKGISSTNRSSSRAVSYSSWALTVASLFPFRVSKVDWALGTSELSNKWGATQGF